MKVTVNAFSSVKIICGFEEKHMDIPEGASVRDVLENLCNEYKEMLKMKGRLLFAVNEEYCNEEKIIKEGDIIAVFPPVSGG